LVLLEGVLAAHNQDVDEGNGLFTFSAAWLIAAQLINDAQRRHGDCHVQQSGSRSPLIDNT